MSMPELPELEILRRDLDKEVTGKKIKSVEITGTQTTKRGGTQKSLLARLDGHKIDSVSRKGTWIVLGLDSGEKAMISLGAGAGLRRNQAKDAPQPGLAVNITFTQGGQLRLLDPKKSCEFFVVGEDEVADVVGEIGFDLVEEAIPWTKFGEQLLRRNAKLKAILMDPTFLVGIGPMYSDEILFESGLRYDRTPEGLSTQELRRLSRAAVEIVHDSIKHGGASVGPDGWVNLHGEAGSYNEFINVHHRDGEMSPRARGPIVKAKFQGAYTYFCEQTQV